MHWILLISSGSLFTVSLETPTAHAVVYATVELAYNHQRLFFLLLVGRAGLLLRILVGLVTRLDTHGQLPRVTLAKYLPLGLEYHFGVFLAALALESVDVTIGIGWAFVAINIRFS